MAARNNDVTSLYHVRMDDFEWEWMGGGVARGVFIIF